MLICRTPVSDDIEWPLYNESKPIYHVWNAAELDVGYGPRATECQFWNGFFPKIGMSPNIYNAYIFRHKNVCTFLVNKNIIYLLKICNIHEPSFNYISFVLVVQKPTFTIYGKK